MLTLFFLLVFFPRRLSKRIHFSNRTNSMKSRSRKFWLFYQFPPILNLNFERLDWSSLTRNYHQMRRSERILPPRTFNIFIHKFDKFQFLQVSIFRLCLFWNHIETFQFHRSAGKRSLKEFCCFHRKGVTSFSKINNCFRILDPTRMLAQKINNRNYFLCVFKATDKVIRYKRPQLKQED